MDQTERRTEFVEALAKGLAVLEAFDATHPEMTLTEVARRIGASPATARRSLITLAVLGYVGQSGKRFHLRPKVLSLGTAFHVSAGLDDLILPHLEHIVETFGDASCVATLDGHDVICIARTARQCARRPSAVAGARYPAHATSLGRVLLAGLPDDALDAYFATVKPQALTSKTVVSVSELRGLIRQVRQLGYATAVDQLEYGTTALAVPIGSLGGATVAALNSSTCTGQVTPERMVAERLAQLRVAASRIANSATRHPVLRSALGGP